VTSLMWAATSSFVQREYEQLTALIAWLGIDEFTGSPATVPQQTQVVALDRLTGAAKFGDGAGVVDLAWTPSPHVKGLRVTTRLGGPGQPMRDVDGADALVIGTIRMGFGHHRIAYAAASWGVKSGSSKDEAAFPSGVYFHDLLSIESAEAGLIRDTDKIYRTSSRLATELGGPFEWLHGYMTSSGDATSLRTTALVAARLAPLVRGLPRGCAFVATHSLTALAATLSNITDRVLNLVIDNHPQWFVVSPGALNLMQGPRNYLGFVAKTGSTRGLRWAGHWVPRDVVDNVVADCDARIARAVARGGATPGTKVPPLRVLVPVGGAGAQRHFITSLVERLADDVKAGTVALVLNAGDHADIQDALVETLRASGLVGDDALKSSFLRVSTMAEARGLAAALGKKMAGGPRVALMAFDDYFAAVAATDTLARVVDVLACKPSELAFYPVPKLMIRRVGDHEAFSANRANELGDGTEELRTVDAALTYLRLFAADPEPLLVMNAAIKRNAAAGVYDGCKTATELAGRVVSS